MSRRLCQPKVNRWVYYEEIRTLKCSIGANAFRSRDLCARVMVARIRGKGADMKVAIVCDSIGEFGGAERVVLALAEIFPRAPIYTSFKKKGPFLDRLKGRDIRVSWANYIPFFSTKLHSPLRFLAPFIWGSFDFSGYDLVISSSSWYITKGWGKRGRKENMGPIEICYCHTPPRWLYGYDTPYPKDKNFVVKAYISLIAHFIRIYDFEASQKVDYFIANSLNTKARIEKFYRREATVVYPPIEISQGNRGRKGSRGPRDYYLIVSRITGGKGLEMAVEAVNQLKIPLKIAGLPSGYSDTYNWIEKNAGPTVEMLGFVDDTQLAQLYSEARGFLAMARDEDFGMTPVEAMGYGVPVVAYNGGGYGESVVDGETGVLFDDYSVEGLIGGIRKMGEVRIKPEDCRKQAAKFSEARFKKEVLDFVQSVM